LSVSTEILIRISVFMLYVPVCLFSFWRLLPRLSPSAKRLASSMLAAQILIILIAQIRQPASDFDRWMWDFHEEWNIPATFAYLQLATVGGVALLTSWLARGRSAWQRLYLVATGLIFLFLAADEYLALHEAIPDWELRYIALGIVLVSATLLVALRSPRRAWLWHVCLLAGLGLSVAGAIVINQLPIPCDGFGFLRFDGCVEFFFLEESFEFLGIWLTLVAALGHFSDVAPMPSRPTQRGLYALPLVCLLVLIFNSLVPRLELRLLAQPASVRFKSDIVLRGFRIDQDLNGAVLRLYVSARQADYLGLGYSIHFVDQASGESLASRDEWADRQHGIWLLGTDYAPIYRQWIDVSIPPETPVNRAYWVVLALWRRQEGGEYKRQKVLASDLQLLDDRQVVLGESVLPAVESGWSSVPLAAFDNGFALEAVEWRVDRATSIPEGAQADKRLDITFTWRSHADGLDDYSQFLHIVHASPPGEGAESVESGQWWGYDQFPLGARLPTRLWYSGLADSETWKLPLPTDIPAGRYTMYTGLYRASDLERVPVTDADGTPWLDNRVALGDLEVE